MNELETLVNIIGHISRATGQPEADVEAKTTLKEAAMFLIGNAYGSGGAGRTGS